MVLTYMKNIFKKSNVLSFIIGGFIFGIIGIVSATILYQANEIGYTPNDESEINNVQDALDDLYNRTNRFSNLVLKIRTESYSKNDNGTSNYNLDNSSVKIRDNYSYFKITNVETNNNLREYQIWGYNVNTSSNVRLSLNTEYSTSNIANIWVVAWSTADGQMGYVIPTTEFYNK